jgi:1-deoxy-D-xylulose-5-phosphate reductoisomerase
MKNLSILGSTGSIGTNALAVVARFPERFRVQALTAKANIALLAEQVKKFLPAMAVVYDEKGAAELQKLLPSDMDVNIRIGEEGYVAAATLDASDLVVAAMVGAAGLTPRLRPFNRVKPLRWPTRKPWSWPGNW